MFCLEEINNENLKYYREYETAFLNELKQYQSRIYPVENPEKLFWYHIKCDGKYVGAVWLEKSSGDDFSVLGMFIADCNYRNKGIGKSAIEEIIKKDILNMNVSKILLRVRQENLRAIACYKSVGFKEVGRYKKNDIDVVEMILKTEFETTKMNIFAAKQICGWKYDAPYSVYNYMSYEEALDNNAAIVNPQNANDYICFWKGKVLAAYISIIFKDEKVFIGIGLAPQLCGQGFGKRYVDYAVGAARNKYPDREIQMQVRSWNKRAISCYKKCGFSEKYNKILKDRFGNKTEFVFMCYDK